MGGVTIKEFAEIVIPSAVVKLNETEAFRVYALDMATLLEAFKDYQDLLDNLMSGKSGVALGRMVNEFPDVTARVIARAVGGMEFEEKAKKLPMGVQMDALAKIFDLTFPDQDLLGKFWARLEAIVESVAKSYTMKIAELSGTTTS